MQHSSLEEQSELKIIAHFIFVIYTESLYVMQNDQLHFRSFTTKFILLEPHFLPSNQFYFDNLIGNMFCWIPNNIQGYTNFLYGFIA